uniref:Uncharacterized protein n=1 Tax=Rhizophora mucronata TaxID=61149 RepID=A0A2P2L6R4_RHIMU
MKIHGQGYLANMDQFRSSSNKQNLDIVKHFNCI